MLNGGFLRLAECHDILDDDPQRVAKYDAIVKASNDDFLADLTHYNGAQPAREQHEDRIGGLLNLDVLVVDIFDCSSVAATISGLPESDIENITLQDLL